MVTVETRKIILQDIDGYGIEWTQPVGVDEDDAIVLEEILQQMCDNQCRVFCDSIDPLAISSDGFGIDIYIKAVLKMHELLRT